MQARNYLCRWLPIGIVALSAIANAQPLTVIIKSPIAGITAVDTLSVIARVENNIFEIASMEAKVEGRIQSFNRTGNPGSNEFVARIPLTGLQAKEYWLAVTVKDLNGDSATDSVAFFNATPIQLKVLSPNSYSVARPKIHLKAIVQGFADSVRMEVSYKNVMGGVLYSGQLAVGYGSIDTVVSLSAYEGDLLAVQYKLYYRNTLIRSQETYALYLNTASLIPVDSVDGQLVDYDGVSFVYVDSNGNFAIKKRGNDSVTVIPNPPGYVIDSTMVNSDNMALLTKEGFVAKFHLKDQSLNYWFHWKNGHFATSPECFKCIHDLVASPNRNWVAWIAGANSVVLSGKDLSPDTVTVADTVEDPSLNVSDDGTVAFIGRVNGETKIYLHKADSTWTLTSTGGVLNPVVGDNSFLYTRAENSGYALILKDGSQARVLSQGGDGFSLKAIVAGPWIAYPHQDPGGLGPTQVWLMSSSDSSRQVSRFAQPGFLSSVSRHGQVTFISGSRRYYSAYGEPAFDAGPQHSYERFIEDSLFVLYGNTLFRFSKPIPVHIVPMARAKVESMRFRMSGNAAFPVLSIISGSTFAGPVSIRLLDLQGRSVTPPLVRPAGTPEIRIAYPAMKPGLYFVIVEAGNRKVAGNVLLSP